MSAELLIASYLRTAFDRDADAVQAALAAAAQRFGVDLNKPDDPAQNADPIR